METKINILRPFFEGPDKDFQIRELSRLLKINHTTIRQYLIRLVKEDLIEIKKGKPYDYFRAKINKKFLNFKLFFNLEKLRESILIEQIEKDYDYPVIILFGSYANATDDSDSDIDLFVISKGKKLDLDNFEKKINRKINIFFSEKFNKLSKKLLQKICQLVD